MDGQPDVCGVRAQLDGQRGLGDQVAGIGPDDAAADDPVVVSSKITLVMPSSRPSDSERPLAAHGKLALPYLMPACGSLDFGNHH